MPGRKQRVFLDTNVFFSALYSPRGAPAQILDRFLDGSLTVVISQQVLEEMVRTLETKLPQTLPTLKTLLTAAPPDIVKDQPLEDTAKWAKVVPPPDAAILAAAVAAKPDFFVTGDRHFLAGPQIASESGLTILTPAQFLKAVPKAD